MKKIVTILISFLFISFQSANADVGVGISGAMHSFDVSGTETVRESAATNTANHSEDVLVGELFVEAISDAGHTIGISYIPTRDMGSKSRSDTTTSGDGQDTGTYTAKAELDNVVQVYTDIVMLNVSGFQLYGKLGIQHATITTLESLNSGSAYPDADVLGTTVGLGVKGDLPYGNNLYYKAEVAYTDFDDYSAISTADNKISADLEDTVARVSVGYKF